MTDFDLAPGILHRGLGFVARWPGITVVIPSDPAHDRAVEEMLAGFGPEPAPAEVARVIQELIQQGTIRDIGYLAMAIGGPLAMVYGAVEVIVDGSAVLSGAGGPTERQVAANERLTMRAANLAKAAEAAGPYDLRRGVAPGAGITLGVPVSSANAVPAAPPRPDHAPPRPHHAPPDPGVGQAPEPAEVEVPYRSVLLFDQGLPVAPLEPLAVAARAPTLDPAVPGVAPADDIGHPAPSHRHSGVVPVPEPGSDEVVVHGIMCSRGHFNNPAASFCMVCGISMVHVTHNLVPGPRPTLGFVVFDDGSTFGLDRSYLIGREPGEPDDRYTAPLTIQDNNETLSRRHAELRLVDWAVHLVDLGSTNGSFIWDVTMERWNQLAPAQPVALSQGDTIALGRRTFVYESVTRI